MKLPKGIWRQPGGEAPPLVRAPNFSMTLLTEVMEHPLDQGYADAAAERAKKGGRAQRTPISTALIALIAAALGLGTATAAEALRVPQPVLSETRALLTQDITTRNEQIAELSHQADELADEIAQLQDSALANLDPETASLIQTDSLRNGSLPVTGPGLVITLSDGGGGLGEANPDALVRDSDLQRVIGYLWAAGAEAIAVDDQRLTMTSAVRNAGAAILVDLIPLSGPTYTIRAIGSPSALADGWAASDGPAYLQLLGNQYGIRSSAVPQSVLELPSATSQSLRFAEPITSAP